MGRAGLMFVAGVDFSSHAIDVVLVDLDGDRPPEWHRFRLMGQDAFDRARSVADAMPGRSSVFWEDTLAVGIEHPAGRHGTGPLMRIQGAVLSMLPARMLVKPWTPAGWRKAVGIAGNATKKRVAEWATWEGGLGKNAIFWPQDATDAWCMALATRQAITTEKAA